MIFQSMDYNNADLNDFVWENLVISYQPSRSTVNLVRIHGIFGWHEEQRAHFTTATGDD